MSKIVIFGDSLVQGALDLEKGGWANRLKIFFWQENIKNSGIYYEGINVINFGIGGDTVADVLDRFDCEINAVREEVDKIIFAVGINDAGFRNNKKVNNKKNFEKEFQLLINKGIKKVGVAEDISVVCITNVSAVALDGWFDENRLIEFDNIIKDIVNNTGCNLIPMHGILTESDFCDDGLHPNAQGHKKMFERIKDFLAENNIV